MPLLFMMILPQVDVRDTVMSQAADGLQGGCVVGEEEAARGLSDGQDAPAFELNIDALCRNPEAGCQIGLLSNGLPPPAIMFADVAP